MDDAEVVPAASSDTASSVVEDVLYDPEAMEFIDGEDGEQNPQLDTDGWNGNDDSVEAKNAWRETGSLETEDVNVLEEGDAKASNSSEDIIPEDERISVNTEGETREGNSIDENADKVESGLTSYASMEAEESEGVGNQIEDQASLAGTGEGDEADDVATSSKELSMEAEESEGVGNQIEDEASLAGTGEGVETDHVATSSNEQPEGRNADMEENEHDLQENTVSISNTVDAGDEELSDDKSGFEQVDQAQSMEGAPIGDEEPPEIEDELIRSDENPKLCTDGENVKEADEKNATRQEVEPAEELALEPEEWSSPAPSEELEPEEWINVEDDTPVLSIDGEEEDQALDESSSAADKGEANETPDVVTDGGDVPSLNVEDGETEQALEAETEVELSSPQPLATTDTDDHDDLQDSKAESEDSREEAKAEDFPENDTSEPEEVNSSNHISFEDINNPVVVDAENAHSFSKEFPTLAVLQDPLPEDTGPSGKEESTLDEVEEPEDNGSPETASQRGAPLESTTEENLIFRGDNHRAGESTEDQKELAGRRDPDTSSEESPEVVEITGKFSNDQSPYVLQNRGDGLQEVSAAPDSVSAENTEGQDTSNLVESNVAAKMHFPTGRDDELLKILGMSESRMPEPDNGMPAIGGENSPLQVETESMQKDEPSIPLSTYNGDLNSSWAAAMGKGGKDILEKQSEIYNKSSLRETDTPEPPEGSVPKVRAQSVRESDDPSEVKFPFSIMLWCSQTLSSLFGSSKSL